MEFLAGAFAAVGAAAASIPIVLHMLRRAPTQNMPFSIVRFLTPTRPKLTKRSTVEHWPLLLLRILALVLIGLAFARPFQRIATPAEDSTDAVQKVAILVDRSASMRREGIRAQVLDAIQETVNQLDDADTLSVSVYSTRTSTLISEDAWRKATSGERQSMVKSVLEQYEPDWMATSTGSALRQIADELAQEDSSHRDIQRRRVVLITDFQEGSDLDPLKSASWPASVEIELKTVVPVEPGNVGVAWFQDRKSGRLRVRVASAGDTRKTDYQLQTFDESGAAVGKPIPVTVSPGQRITVLLPDADEETSRAIAGVELVGDMHPFDNVVDLPTTENPLITVVHIGPSERNNPESMRYYLQRVLDGTTHRRVELIDAMPEDGVVLPISHEAKLVVATDAIPDGLQASLKEFLGRGGTLLAALNSTEAAASLSPLLPGLKATEAQVRDYAMLSSVNFDYPMFAAFSNQKFADFSSIRVWKYRQLTLPASPGNGDFHVIARFDSGSPAIMQAAAEEKGSVIVLATGWQPDDSQWALSTRFPPMLSSVLEMADPEQSSQPSRTVGDMIRPEELVNSSSWEIETPLRQIMTSAELEDSSGRPTTVVLEQPGRYHLTSVGDEPASVTLIATLAPAESRTEALPRGQLQVLGIDANNLKSDIASSAISDDNDETLNPGQLSSTELESRQKLWRWLLLAGLACLLVESVLASIIQRRQVGSEA